MIRHFEYVKAVLVHKWYVFIACLWFNVPIWTAIIHDWDKFTPLVWRGYANFFYGNPPKSGRWRHAFDLAFRAHQKRNKHHWQHWLLCDGIPLPQTNIYVNESGMAFIYLADSEVFYEWHGDIVSRPMPEADRREMLADWVGAGRLKTQNWTRLEPLRWYQQNNGLMLHPDTRAWVEEQLVRFAESTGKTVMRPPRFGKSTMVRNWFNTDKDDSQSQ